MGGVSDQRALWLTRFVLPHERSLRSFLRKMHLPEDLDIDDVVQEAYSKLTAMDDVESIRDPRAYFFSVARSTVLMHVRRSKVVAIRTVDDIEVYAAGGDEHSPERQASDRQQLLLLGIAIAELKDPGRKTLLLRLMEGLSYKEIAERLGTTDNAVQKSIAKSVGLLLRKLAGGEHGNAAASGQRQRKEEVPHEARRDQRGN